MATTTTYNYVQIGAKYTTTSVWDVNSSSTLVADAVGKVPASSSYTYVATGSTAQNIQVNSAHAWNVTGTTESDVIYGNSGNDTLIGGGAATGAGDTLYGGDGNDTFVVHGAGNVVLADYTYGQDTIVLDETSAADLAGYAYGGSTAASAGVIKATDTSNVTIGVTDNYSKVTVKAATGGAKLNVWFGSSAEALMDGSAQTSALYMIGDQNGTVGDTMYGGSGNDTIMAGTNDVVWGGAGNDQITIKASAQNVVVGLNAASGRDTVTANFAGQTGVVYLFDNALADATFTNNGSGNVVASVGSANLTLKVASANEYTFKVKDNTGTTSDVDVVANSTTAATNYKADTIVVTKGTNAGKVNFTGADTEQVIDLANGAYGAYGDTRKYVNVVNADGATNYANMLIGSSDKNVLNAGNMGDSLWGGDDTVADTLKGGNGNDTFFYGVGEGNDYIQSYRYATNNTDTIKLFNANGFDAVTTDTAAGGNVVLTVGTGKLTVDATFTNNYATVKAATADGKTYVADVAAAGTATTFAYNDDVNIYYGSNKVDTLAFATGDADNHKVYLDGRTGTVYNSVEVIDGTNATGDLELAGNSSSNTIKGGAGNSTLWGGAGDVSDTLVGGTGNATYWYELGNGKDTIAVGSKTDDKVMLNNISAGDITSNAITAGNLVISFKDGGSLTVKGFGDGSSAVNTFTLGGDNSTWSYDKDKKEFVKA